MTFLPSVLNHGPGGPQLPRASVERLGGAPACCTQTAPAIAEAGPPHQEQCPHLPGTATLLFSVASGVLCYRHCCVNSARESDRQVIVLADQVPYYQRKRWALIYHELYTFIWNYKFINIISFTEKKPINRKFWKPIRNSLLILINRHCLPGRNVFILFCIFLKLFNIICSFHWQLKYTAFSIF